MVHCGHSSRACLFSPPPVRYKTGTMPGRTRVSLPPADAVEDRVAMCGVERPIGLRAGPDTSPGRALPPDIKTQTSGEPRAEGHVEILGDESGMSFAYSCRLSFNVVTVASQPPFPVLRPIHPRRHLRAGSPMLNRSFLLSGQYRLSV